MAAVAEVVVVRADDDRRVLAARRLRARQARDDVEGRLARKVERDLEVGLHGLLVDEVGEQRREDGALEEEHGEAGVGVALGARL